MYLNEQQARPAEAPVNAFNINVSAFNIQLVDVQVQSIIPFPFLAPPAPALPVPLQYILLFIPVSPAFSALSQPSQYVPAVGVVQDPSCM